MISSSLLPQRGRLARLALLTLLAWLVSACSGGAIALPGSCRNGLRDSATALPTSTLLRPGFSIDQLEHSLIHEAIARASGNKTEAARMLGITRRRLYSRLKSLAGEGGGAASEDLPEDRSERPL
mgnify:CR=1 FL=1